MAGDNKLHLLELKQDLRHAADDNKALTTLVAE
jgi:hypothetical protein